MPAPVALILGAGANVGQAVARAFAAKGYKIALVARSLPKETSSPADYLHIRGDLADPSSVAGIFAQVKKELGLPNVVVYNAAAGRPAADPFAMPLNDFVSTLHINTTSVYAAAKEAVAAFSETSTPGVFIFTGNITNTKPIPVMAPMSAGKSATAALIQSAVESAKFPGARFYYADERKADGSPAYGAIDGEAHAELYTSLARSSTQGPWLQTFVKGVGYKAF
ncbi:hypothetical protein Sste5346_006442 [Sporothrix stenoceras]|uniref:Short chain type dehydrogenase n=1 Tax=Sporothrix stenoceras TaxID=5173 RepID=A0ABR3YZ18_9PEZI